MPCSLLSIEAIDGFKIEINTKELLINQPTNWGGVDELSGGR
jgi:hypothetical protein